MQLRFSLLLGVTALTAALAWPANETWYIIGLFLLILAAWPVQIRLLTKKAAGLSEIEYTVDENRIVRLRNRKGEQSWPLAGFQKFTVESRPDGNRFTGRGPAGRLQIMSIDNDDMQSLTAILERHCHNHDCELINRLEESISVPPAGWLLLLPAAAALGLYFSAKIDLLIFFPVLFADTSVFLGWLGWYIRKENGNLKKFRPLWPAFIMSNLFLLLSTARFFL